VADEPNLLACSFGTAAYSAPAGAKVRVLTCDVSGGVDLTRSHHALFYNYQGTGSNTTEHYAGHISSVGADLGYTKEAKIV
jgi:hypothetical protein